MRRLLLLLAAIVSGGCKTAEFAVDHQITGLRVAAKFEAKDTGGPEDSDTRWNGGDAMALMRR
jgi:hypothetical protein